MTGASSRGLVVELASDDVAASYCAKVLLSVGFEVVKVEPPGGDPQRRAAPFVATPAGERSTLFEYLNASKRSVVADLADPDGWAAAEPLIAAADLVLLAVNGDAEAVDARQRRVAGLNPAAVRVVTSSYGLTGPYRNLPRTDITDWAASGYLFTTGDPDREPLSGGSPLPAYITGQTAAIGALAAWRAARAGGPGRLVDTGTMETMAALHQWTLTQYTYQGYIKRRAGNRHGEFHHPVAFLECADGWVCIGAPGTTQWDRLAEAVGMPELTTDPRFQTSGERYDHADEVDALLAPWLMAHGCRDVAALLQRARIPAGVVYDVGDVLQDDHLRAREFFQAVDIGGRVLEMPGPPIALGPPVQWQPAPDIGTAPGGPPLARRPPGAGPADGAGGTQPGTDRGLLTGVRVLDLTRAWAGPLAGRFLADLGAEVIHVEYATARAAGVVGTRGYDLGEASPWDWGDLPEPSIRAGVFPNADPGADPWNRQASFNKLNRNKLSLSVDLHEPDGLELFQRLVAVSDVVLENYSPRGALSLGVVFELLRETNPRIVVVSISGYGHTGPDPDRLALGPVIEAESGLAALTGYRGGGPTKLGAAIPDPVSGLNAAAAVIAALAERDATGRGLHVDISMLESFAAIGGEAFLYASDRGVAPPRPGNRSPSFAPQGVYPCAGDDEWIALAVRSDAEWRRLVDVVDAPPLRHARFLNGAVRALEQPYLDRVIASWTGGRSKWEAWRPLVDAGIPAMPVMTNADLVYDPQLEDRGFIVQWDQPGIGPRRYPGLPLHFDPPTPIAMRPAATLGADNRRILRDLLRYDEDTIDGLERRRVITTTPEGIADAAPAGAEPSR